MCRQSSGRGCLMVPLAVVINTGTMLPAPFTLIMLWLAGSYVKINAFAMLSHLHDFAPRHRRNAAEGAERRVDVRNYLSAPQYCLSARSDVHRRQHVNAGDTQKSRTSPPFICINGCNLPATLPLLTSRAAGCLIKQRMFPSHTPAE